MLRLNHKPRPRLIVMIGDDGVLCVPQHVPERPAPFFIESGDGKGAALLAAFLAQRPDISATLFADMLAQDFRREALPRLSPFDRPRLIRRRLRQAFPQARLAAHADLKSARGHILMIGLHDNSPLFDWLERLKLHAPPICLVPVECASLVTRLMPDGRGGWAMLLSRERTGGFRQIVTHKGELAFTRLTPPLPPDAPAKDIAEAIARDIKASLGYLGRLGLGDARQLRVMLLMPEAQHEALETTDLPVHSLTLLSPAKAARHLNLPFVPAADDLFGDLVYAGWLAQKRKPELPLMPPEMKRARQNAAIHFYGLRAALAALSLAFGLIVWQASDLFATLFHNHREAGRLAALQQTLARQQQEAAPVTEPLGRLRQALERERLFASPVAAPWQALRLLDTGLGAARLVKLDWRDDSGKEADETMQIDVRLAADAPAPDHETIAAQFRQVARDIARAMPAYDVAITRFPFPALPQEALSGGSDKGGDDAGATAELTIRRNAP